MIHQIKIRHRTVKMKETIINQKAPERVLFLCAEQIKKRYESGNHSFG